MYVEYVLYTTTSKQVIISPAGVLYSVKWGRFGFFTVEK